LIRLLALLLALAACAAPVPKADIALRDTSRPVYANASFDTARLAGTWTQVGEVTSHPGCAPGRLTVKGKAPAWQVDWQLCLNGHARAGQGALVAVGPGQYALPGSALTWWVLWADADNRTLVLGTPSGAFGLVLDRGAIPADRAKAAIEILRWNGYDIGLLQLSRG
jgi:apolipoprotein D and lipocalin family protein